MEDISGYSHICSAMLPGKTLEAFSGPVESARVQAYKASTCRTWIASDSASPSAAFAETPTQSPSSSPLVSSHLHPLTLYLKRAIIQGTPTPVPCDSA
ncbi:hypothetical protein AAC387_Pa02g3476 [Persea americana]